MAEGGLYYLSGGIIQNHSARVSSWRGDALFIGHCPSTFLANVFDEVSSHVTKDMDLAKFAKEHTYSYVKITSLLEIWYFKKLLNASKLHPPEQQR